MVETRNVENYIYIYEFKILDFKYLPNKAYNTAIIYKFKIIIS